MAWHGPDTDVAGVNHFGASRLIQTENLSTADARYKTAEAIKATGGGSFFITAGKGTMDADPNGETSVLPAWRKTVIHYALDTRFNDETDKEDPSVWKSASLCSSWKIRKLREITPNSGAYLNEGNYYEPNWPKSYFGDNYEELVEIKKKYDPESMF